MPKIVDKKEKRKIIAKSTCSLFIEEGFVNISISQIAKVAGIGKGTIYEYFENKEDVVFELMSCLQEDYDPKLTKNLELLSTPKQKIFYLFELFLSDESMIKIQRKIYREYLAIYLSNPSEKILQYHIKLKEKYINILTDILTVHINSNELSSDILKFIPSIFATVEGFFINNENSKDEIIQYINNIFEIIQINNKDKEK